MLPKDAGKTAELSIQEQSASLRQEFSTAIKKGQSLSLLIQPNVYAMTFATSQELLALMRASRLSVVISFENKEVFIQLVRSVSEGQVNFTRALTDHGYRNSLLERWYTSLCGALQDNDDEKATEIADKVLSQSAAPLGLVDLEDGEAITIFDLEHSELRRNLFMHFNSMKNLAGFGTLNTRDRIHDYLISMWKIMGIVDPAKQQSMLDKSPEVIFGATSGSALHSDW